MEGLALVDALYSIEQAPQESPDLLLPQSAGLLFEEGIHGEGEVLEIYVIFAASVTKITRLYFYLDNAHQKGTFVVVHLETVHEILLCIGFHHEFVDRFDHFPAGKLIVEPPDLPEVVQLNRGEGDEAITGI